MTEKGSLKQLIQSKYLPANIWKAVKTEFYFFLFLNRKTKKNKQIL